MSKDIQKKDPYLPPSVRNLDPYLKAVHDRFNLNEEFQTFLDRNQDVRGCQPDIGFLLMLLEQQREAILNLEQRVAIMEKNGYVDRHIAVPPPESLIKEMTK